MVPSGKQIKTRRRLRNQREEDLGVCNVDSWGFTACVLLTYLCGLIRRTHSRLRDPDGVFDKICCVGFEGFRMNAGLPHGVDRLVDGVEKNS